MVGVEEQMTAQTDVKQGQAASDSRQTVLAARRLTKIFKDFWGRPKAKAVSDVNFEVKRGEVFGLLGPNGSGKTTTVKIILGLLYPTKGHVEILGHSPRHVATKSRIGYLPEESYLYRYLDSRETIDFFGSLFQMDSAERRRRGEQLLEMVGLKAVQRRTVGEFSKGMQRRIGLAQALINDPDLIILDEPTAGLDPIGCREVKDLIVALARRGKTVILSSHLLADVEDVCDRVVIYYGGRIQATGSMKELLAEPNELTMTVPALSRETMERVLETVRQEVADDKIKIDVPTKNLEAYFLDVVQRAREAELANSGATAGSQVAEYLKGEASSERSPHKVLERLAQPKSEAKEPEVTVPPDPKAAAEEKLAGLTQRQGSDANAPASEANEGSSGQEGSKGEDERKANERLSKLSRQTGSKRSNDRSG